MKTNWLILVFTAVILISLFFYFATKNKGNTHQNEQINADILQDNAPPVMIHGNCINGKVYSKGDNEEFQIVLVGKDPVECK